METYSNFYRRAFLVATAVALGFVVVDLLRPFWGALEWAAVLAFLLHPLQKRLSRSFHDRPGLAAGTLTALTPFVIIAPLSIFAVIFAHQAAGLIDYFRTHPLLSMPAMLDRLQHFPLIGASVRWIQANVPISFDQVQEWATEGARSVLQSTASLSGHFALGLAGSLVGFSFMLFLLFFFLRDGAAMLGHAVRLIPIAEDRRTVLITHLSSVLRAVVFGTVATAIIQGALSGVGFAIAGLPSPVVLGALAALASFVPAVGSALVLAPAVAYLLITQHWGAALFLGLWSIATAVAEQLLRPLLSRRHGGVSTLAVFIGAIGGVGTFGLIGVVIGPVLLSLVVELVRMAEELRGSDA